jgi:hypothetical protein
LDRTARRDSKLAAEDDRKTLPPEAADWIALVADEQQRA